MTCSVEVLDDAIRINGKANYHPVKKTICIVYETAVGYAPLTLSVCLARLLD